MRNEKQKRVDRDRLPEQYPTHLHRPEFWEALGRCVATFGFLEEILGKAIFALTGTKPYSEEKIRQAYDYWFQKLEHALFDPLDPLIKNYGAAVREHPLAPTSNLQELLNNLREASKIRNVLCHGSWQHLPNSAGASTPLFINRKMEMFDTAIDIEFLDQTQKCTVELACDITDSVISMGLPFPGALQTGTFLRVDE